MDTYLNLENRHTGEWLRLRRIREGGQDILELEGGVPSHGEGPPNHVHPLQDEDGVVVSGVLSARIGKETFTFKPGERAFFPRGVPHAWWNDGDEPLVFKGRAIPAGELDRFLQAIFAVVNAAPKGRPSLFHIAHVARRHRAGNRLTAMPSWVLTLVFPLVIAIGRLVGAYPAGKWPGAPELCPGAPLVEPTAMDGTKVA